MAADEQSGPSLTMDSPESHVIDEAGYSHQRRLQAIHDARDRVIEVRNAVEEQLITDSIDELRARQFYRGAVKSLVLEIQPILNSNQITLEEDYLEGVELGTVTVEPPQWLVRHAQENINRLAPGQRVPTPEVYEVRGLNSIVDLPSPIVKEWTVVTRGGRRRRAGESGVARTELSRDVLDAAVTQIGQALEEAEMGLNIGEDRPHNSLSAGNKKPWEQLLPHEVVDAYEEGALTKELVEDLREEHREEQEDDGDE